jgi:hypothetical protein
MTDLIKESLSLNCIKDKYLIIVQLYIIKVINEKVTELYTVALCDYNQYINKQVLNIIVFINHQKTLLLNTHVSDLKSSFEMIIEKIYDTFNLDILNKISYKQFKIKIEDNNITITPKLIWYDIIKKQKGSKPVKNLTEESKEYDKDIIYKNIFDNSELNDYKTENTLKLDEIVKNYLIQFEGEFNKIRKEKLPVILKEMQKDKPKLDSNNYLSVKKIYIDNLKLFRELKCEGINTLTIFNHINNLSHKITDFGKEIVISKYIFIVNKLDIHTIYTQEDFDEKYKDILPYLKQMTDDFLLNYNITLIIIDILFKKALLI